MAAVSVAVRPECRHNATSRGEMVCGAPRGAVQREGGQQCSVVGACKAHSGATQQTYKLCNKACNKSWVL